VITASLEAGFATAHQWPEIDFYLKTPERDPKVILTLSSLRHLAAAKKSFLLK
jgi:hypothetical protein